MGMIKNDEQYRITEAQIRRFEDALAEMAHQERPPNVTPRLWKAQRDAAQSRLDELQDAVVEYERLSRGQA